MKIECDVAVIGAGPAGAVAAANLVRRGWRVEVIERARFPRFSIGESLLPQSMVFIEEAGLLPEIEAAGFQLKNGASFRRGADDQVFEFDQKTATGWSTTFQVLRSRFDELLARGAAMMGAQVSFGEEVTAFEADATRVRLRVRDEQAGEREIVAHKVLDASGYGRALARLLDLEKPTGFPQRTSLFRHVADHISPGAFDRDKILISIHPELTDVWYWLIPLADGISSVGVVGPAEAIDAAGVDDEVRFAALIAASGHMAELLAQAEPKRDVGRISGYSASVSQLHGPGWALLGNAAEFLDPVFSSGVTIALKSASLAADLTDRELRGEAVDWDKDYDGALKVGVDTFRAFVTSWYTGELQEIIFGQPDRETELKRMIISVLAGYAWDRDNVFVRDPQRYLRLVGHLCRVG